MAESSDRKKAAKTERGTAQARESARERRASHRVSDDQQSGQGSASALSKLRMLERKRAPIRSLRDDEI